jgi:superfamily II DNA or RNA helicase
MKFTLKDYQDDAVRDALKHLRKAQKDWRDDQYRSAFSLAAVTGAGKTVMAAAAFEALFHGDDERDSDPDPGAVVIWFSDSPSLNEQTRARLIQAADRINLTDMVVVENTFQREKFQPGKIYFLNTQKLGKKSLLVRGHDPEGEFPQIRPDLRSYTIWDTIKNTIEDPALTLYLVLDEAHRGMGNGAATDAERSTIVKRLINGVGSVPAIPIVWGISATVARFNKAMEGAQDRTKLPDVTVDAAKVQDSGLLKDTIILDVPTEKGDFETVLVRRAADKIKEATVAWAAYSKEQGAESVTPLMVLQVPNNPEPARVAKWIDTIRDRWPELDTDAFANVFGEHRTEMFGAHAVPYVEPQRVQDSNWVRVLIAKDAVSTGWDCPRAEVMISFRPASDKTHITQLLGRMVRTPLARRIPGNDRLNSVDCLLPKFDRETVEAVAEALMKGATDGEGDIPGRRVLINPKEMAPNPKVSEKVWDKLLSLPSQSLPQRVAKPVRRLTALAHELAWDKLLPDAGKKAHVAMHSVLDAAAAEFAAKIAAARKSMLTVEGATMRADLRRQEKSFDEFVEASDYAVIEDVYRRAAREYSPDVTKSYAEHLADKAVAEDASLDIEDALIDAHTEIAAMGLVPENRERLDGAADRLASEWFATYDERIKALSHERQEQYREIKRMSSEPQDVNLAQPESRWEPTTARDVDGTEKPLPTYKQHLLSDADGRFPAELNGPERRVLKAEMERGDFLAWYRNPPRSSQDSLGVAYEYANKCEIVRPDFLFFANDSQSIVADIVDPHGDFLADALPKLKGLAAYAEAHSGHYRRIEAISEIGDTLRMLDLQKPEVRKAVIEAADAKSLYESSVATNY